MSSSDRKSNGPLKGPQDTTQDTGDDPLVDFHTLQMAIDSGQWKEDPYYLEWIYQQMGKLVQAGKKTPPDFGSPAFWSAILGEEEAAQGDAVDQAIDKAFDQQGTCLARKCAFLPRPSFLRRPIRAAH